jgi:hypothetical protein
LVDAITSLAKEYDRFENTAFDSTLPQLRRLVISTHDCCRRPEVGAFASRLESVASPTPQIAAAVKTLRQLEKIGAYWRIASSLVDTATEFPESFHRIEVNHVVPYAETPTDIAHESWAKTMHVHAEVQLVVEYSIRRQNEKEREDEAKGARTIIWPRTIGTSKYLCFLCYLFLREHAGFGQALSSHGRLFDQWTIPDLEEFDEVTRRKFAEVVLGMNDAVLEQTGALQKDVVWRPEPMTSRQNLLIDHDIPEEDAAMKILEDRMAGLPVQ